MYLAFDLSLVSASLPAPRSIRPSTLAHPPSPVALHKPPLCTEPHRRSAPPSQLYCFFCGVARICILLLGLAFSLGDLIGGPEGSTCLMLPRDFELREGFSDPAEPSQDASTLETFVRMLLLLAARLAGDKGGIDAPSDLAAFTVFALDCPGAVTGAAAAILAEAGDIATAAATVTPAEAGALHLRGALAAPFPAPSRSTACRDCCSSEHLTESDEVRPCKPTLDLDSPTSEGLGAASCVVMAAAAKLLFPEAG